MKHKRILIVSNFLYPEITPRAGRTTELAREFARRGYAVTLVVPNKQAYHDQPLDVEGVTVLYGDSPIAPEGAANARKKLRRFIPGWAMRAILYFWNHEFWAKYDKGVERRLMRLDGDFDMLMSISYPVAIHRAVMRAFARNPRLTARCRIAEFSDPPMRGEYNSSFFPAYGCFLRRMGRFFDRFVIPVENAMPCYLKYKPREEIAVIPQGFDNSGVRVREYRPHSRPTFAYAGRFYRNTRNPRPLFEHLASLDRDFEFVLYLIDVEPYFADMIEELRGKVKGTITVRPALPRNELIHELSAMDFVVNHQFSYSTATPSKLIDYALADRPVFSFSPVEFDTALLDRFLNGDYSGGLTLPPIGDYDIRNIGDKFEALMAGE